MNTINIIKLNNYVKWAIVTFLFISLGCNIAFSQSEEFTTRDVERQCEVYRYSGNYGELECRGLNFVEENCEAYFGDESDETGEIECRGSDLRIIERRCSVTMYSENYGEIEC